MYFLSCSFLLRLPLKLIQDYYIKREKDLNFKKQEENKENIQANIKLLSVEFFQDIVGSIIN